MSMMVRRRALLILLFRVVLPSALASWLMPSRNKFSKFFHHLLLLCNPRTKRKGLKAREEEESQREWNRRRDWGWSVGPMFSRLPALHLQKTRHAGLRIKPAQHFVIGIWRKGVFWYPWQFPHETQLVLANVSAPRGKKMRGGGNDFCVGIECPVQYWKF